HIGSQTQQPIAHRLPTPPDGVSLPLTFDLVPSLNDRDLADLVYQLDRDVSCAQTEADDRSIDQALERLAELDAARE
ncbi:hypothetical protein ACVSQB_38680, partial [Bradyrhizobium elkanii]